MGDEGEVGLGEEADVSGDAEDGLAAESAEGEEAGGDEVSDGDFAATAGLISLLSFAVGGLGSFGGCGCILKRHSQTSTGVHFGCTCALTTPWHVTNVDNDPEKCSTQTLGGRPERHVWGRTAWATMESLECMRM